MDIRRLRREISHCIHLTRPGEFALAVRWLNLGPQDWVCDIGCGDGYWTSRLAGYNRRVFGVDVNPKVVLWAQRFYGQFADFAVANGEKLPFQDNAMHKLISVCALQHFPDDAHALREMYRVLRPGGKLCMSVDSLSLPSISPDYKALQARRYQVRRLYTHVNMGTLLAMVGFSMLRYAYVGTSTVSSWLIQSQVKRGWEVNYLGPIALPLSRLADAVWRRSDAGYSLVVEAVKND